MDRRNAHNARRRLRARRMMVLGPALVSTMVLATTAAWALITPTKVLVMPAIQVLPFSNGTYLAYTSNSRSEPKHFNAYARRLSDGRTIRINASGTEGFEGGFDPGTNTVIYQQVKSASSDIYTFNLDTRVRHRVGQIDTKRWEAQPRISASSITFFREYYSRSTGKPYVGMFIYSRTSGSSRLVAFSDLNIWNGSLGDRYATYTRCGGKSCTAWVYDRRSDIQKGLRIPSPNQVPQYAPVVDETNDLVFFARSGFHCGQGVRILQVPLTRLGAKPTKVAALPTGSDLDNEASLSLNAGTNMYDYLFTRVTCPYNSANIYSVQGVSAGPVTG